jgi:hypothetical protein
MELKADYYQEQKNKTHSRMQLYTRCQEHSRVCIWHPLTKCTENVMWPYLDLANWHPIYKPKPVPTSINKLSWPKSSQVQKSSSSSSPYKARQAPKACRNSCCYDIALVQILNTDHKKMWEARIHVSILCWQEVVWWLQPRWQMP